MEAKGTETHAYSFSYGVDHPTRILMSFLHIFYSTGITFSNPSTTIIIGIDIAATASSRNVAQPKLNFSFVFGDRMLLSSEA
jgi:hypothetical protein